MLIEWFFAYKILPNLLFGVLCLPGDQSHPLAQPTINPLACCICWAGLLGRAVFPPWNEGPNFGSYKVMSLLFNMLSRLVITFLPRSKHLLISWLQSPSAVILLLGNALCSQKNMCTVAPVEKESSYCSISHWDLFSSTFRCFVMKNFSPLFVKIMSFCPFCWVLCRYLLSKCSLSLHCFHIVSSLKGLELMH